jgi:spore maturation protein SpmB
MEEQTRTRGKQQSWLTPFLFLLILIGGIVLFAVPMGLANLLRTVMNTAFSLLIDTCLYIMAIAVIMGALDALLTEFGVVDLLNKLLNPLMKPLYGMPGAAALGVISTYLSDNPAILSLAEEKGFRKYFKKYQFYALTNLGTAFGMGIIVSTFMLGLTIQEPHLVAAVLIGNLGAVVGSIVSTRLMILRTRRLFDEHEYAEDIPVEPEEVFADANLGKKKGPSLGMRVLTASLNGGKSGVEIGLSIIPGVLVVCTLVMLLTKGPSADGSYTGAAYEGIALLPRIAEKLNFILQPLFGFASSESIAVPITALGSAGAATGIVREMAQTGLTNSHDIAVFTAMCMCWSGYMSTHVSMMNSLHCEDLISKAILSHTLGGLCAGVAAHWLYVLFEAIL